MGIQARCLFPIDMLPRRSSRYTVLDGSHQRQDEDHWPDTHARMSGLRYNEALPGVGNALMLCSWEESIMLTYETAMSNITADISILTDVPRLPFEWQSLEPKHCKTHRTTCFSPADLLHLTHHRRNSSLAHAMPVQRLSANQCGCSGGQGSGLYQTCPSAIVWESSSPTPPASQTQPHRNPLHVTLTQGSCLVHAQSSRLMGTCRRARGVCRKRLPRKLTIVG